MNWFLIVNKKSRQTWTHCIVKLLPVNNEYQEIMSHFNRFKLIDELMKNVCATIDPTKLRRHEQRYAKQSWQHLPEMYMAIYHGTHGQHVSMG